jgi:hypothetical protein
MEQNKNLTFALWLRLVLVVSMGFCTPLSMWAQNGAGLIFDDEVYDTLPVMPTYDGSKTLDLPKKVDLRNYCPMAGNQGQLPSCVGWSVGYGAYTIERAIQNKWTDFKTISNEASSAMFIYNNVREGNDCRKAGASIATALNWLKVNGDCLAKEFDNQTGDCDKKPDARAFQSAKKYLLSDFSRVFAKETSAADKITGVKMVLSKNKPVVVGMMVNQVCMSLRSAEYWNPKIGDVATIGHAMTVVGYDDNTNSFLIFNSWGTNWGKNGFIRMKYDDFANQARYAFAIVLDNKRVKPMKLTGDLGDATSSTTQNPPQNTSTTTRPQDTQPVEESSAVVGEAAYDLVEMAGQLSINQHRGQNDRGEHLFEPVAVDFQTDHYVLRKDDWQVGQLFQIALSSGFSGAYVYVFSLNPRNEAKVNFPRDEALNPKYRGMHESPYILLEDARVVLPSPTSALKVEFSGTDRICMLFSLKKITNLNRVCRALERAGGDNFIKKLHSILDDNMIPLTDTQFSDQTVAFKTATRTGASVLPIIIECRAQ